MDPHSNIPFSPDAWLADPVSKCSLAAQGLWLRMMLIMHTVASRYGYLQMGNDGMAPDTVCRLVGCTRGEYDVLLKELDSVGVPRRTASGIIYSKLLLDWKKRFGIKKQKRYWLTSAMACAMVRYGRITAARKIATHTDEEWEALKAEFGFRCVCCGGVQPLTKDHIVPISRCGSDGIENIQPLCSQCNSAKHTKSFNWLVLRRLSGFGVTIL